MLSSVCRPRLTRFRKSLSLHELGSEDGKGLLPHGQCTRIQKRCALLVHSHPSSFLYQFVSLELKRLESFLTPPSPPGKHPVSVPGTGPGNAPWTGPISPARPRPLQPRPTSGHCGGSLRSLLSTLKMFGISF